MIVAYNTQFIMFPPRASVSIKPEHVGRHKKHIAQYKYNGTRTLIFISPDGNINMFNRHQELHKQYKLSRPMIKSIKALGLAANKWHVLDGELMHAKTKGIKDRVVLYDILVHASDYLIGSTYMFRYKLLTRLCGSPQELEQDTGNGIALAVKETLWLAPVFSDDLTDRYADHIDLDEIEGLVLKDPKGKLEFGVTEKNNTGWQIRCRKPHKNYAY
jgi:ATP-dependent DNA ligase